MPPIVWFNKYLSNTWEMLASLHEARAAGALRVLCTHPAPRYRGREHCDVFEQEPSGVAEAGYLDYCGDVARRHQVALFLPGRHVVPIVRAAPRFAAAGTRVLATAASDMLEVLNHKGKCYAALAGESLVPDHALVHDAGEFDAAWARLRPRHALLCFKPAVSVYGLGFRIVADTAPARDRLRAGDPLYIERDEARAAIERRPRPLLVMPYLPGPERSVDCVARAGELLRCVVRRKEKGGQVLEDNPALVAQVRRLTARFRLTHLFNVQFRDAGGRSYLLEINPRMSGGLPFTLASGCNLLLAGLRLALGQVTPADLPQPRTGIWVPQPEPASSL